MYTTWLERIKEPDALDEFMEWVETGSGEDDNQTHNIDKTEFLIEFGGELG